MNWVIQNAHLTNALRIGVLCRELGYSNTDEEMLECLESLLISQSDYIGVAVDETGGIGGWIQAHASQMLESGFRVEIVGMIVDAPCRRLGIGRKLVQAAESWAIQKGASRVVVRSNITRSESHAFYAALGYTENKTQRVYRKLLPTS